ncbi:MAG TPA: transcriptional regulator [Acidimicrobiales bacterium]
MHDPVEAVATLGDGLRRALYDFVVAHGTPVGRDEAAAAVGVKRPLAAYHLDRLARQGLLEVTYARPEGRSGPGAGRPGKLYARAATEIEVTLPPRQYEVPARLLAEAVDRAGAEDTVAALHEAARRAGEDLAAGVADRASLLDVLRRRGYEPYEADGGGIRLRNCPFHQLAADHTELVCGMNLALLAATAVAGVRPVLDPRPGECCVAFTPATPPVAG